MNNNIDKINSFLVSNYCVARGKLQAQNDIKLPFYCMFYNLLASSFFFKIVVTAQLLLVIFKFNTGGAIWCFSILVCSFEPINLCLSFSSVVMWTKIYIWAPLGARRITIVYFCTQTKKIMSKHVYSATNQRETFVLRWSKQSLIIVSFGRKTVAFF